MKHFAQPILVLALCAALGGCETYGDLAGPEVSDPVPESNPNGGSTNFVFEGPPNSQSLPEQVQSGGAASIAPTVGLANIEIKEATVFSRHLHPGVPIVLDVTLRNGESRPVTIEAYSIIFDESDAIEDDHTEYITLPPKQVSRMEIVGASPASNGLKYPVFAVATKAGDGSSNLIDLWNFDPTEISSQPGF
ncbi:hypothetical protein AB0T83_11060 [Fluviibacterium sp. DFM31]|uniref:DUF4352 domain-containing protein n=1 Tax=Meridianimarinicoccus marinus TaxID=3231483 RepID=A0ABV3L6W8_9RHOB